MADTVKRSNEQKNEQKNGVRAQTYPMSAERELARINLTYTNAMLKSFRLYLPELLDMYEIQTRSDSRYDDIGGFREKLSDIFTKIGADFEKATKRFDPLSMVRRVGSIAKNTSVRDWVDIVKKTLGLPIYKEYYDDLLSDRLNRWTAENVSYVTTLPKYQLQELQNIILWGYTTGQPKVNVYNRLQKQLGISKSHARMLARDQLGTLNAQMMREEQQSMGCTKYKWKTRKDDRVRDSHRVLEGKIFDWNEPPEMYYMTKNGPKSTGRRCNPGEDYQCRCVAVPVFDVAVAGEKAAQHRFKA